MAWSESSLNEKRSRGAPHRHHIVIRALLLAQLPRIEVVPRLTPRTQRRFSLLIRRKLTEAKLIQRLATAHGSIAVIRLGDS
jgi:hypothetical protein